MPPTVVPFRAARPGLAARRQLQRSGGRDVCWLTDTRGRHTALVVRAIHVHTVMTPLAMQSTISSHTTCVAPPCVSSPCTARDTPNVLPAVRGGPRRMCSPPDQRLINVVVVWLPRTHVVGIMPAQMRAVLGLHAASPRVECWCWSRRGAVRCHCRAGHDARARRHRPVPPPHITAATIDRTTLVCVNGGNGRAAHSITTPRRHGGAPVVSACEIWLHLTTQPGYT